MNVLDSLIARRSIRRFLNKPVPKCDVESILRNARWAASAANMQPWQVYAVSGKTKDRLSKAVLEQHAAEGNGRDREFPHYPAKWCEPFTTRRNDSAEKLYKSLGIKRADRERRIHQWRRNFVFYDAPVGLLFSMKRQLEYGSLLDYGVFLQSVMLAAQGFGIDSCAMAVWANYHRVAREIVGMGDDEILVCAMALGYQDPCAPENHFRVERESVDRFARFSGF